MQSLGNLCVCDQGSLGHSLTCCRHLAVRLENMLSTATCFTYPRTAVFSLVFISPTIFHHILLIMTLFKTWQFFKRSGQSVALNPLLAVIRRDHILFVLAICLINFSNLVLSLQPGDFPYKLVGYALETPGPTPEADRRDFIHRSISYQLLPSLRSSSERLSSA